MVSFFYDSPLKGKNTMNSLFPFLTSTTNNFLLDHEILSLADWIASRDQSVI